MGRVSIDPKKRTMQETNNRKEDISTGETYLMLKKKQLFVFPAKASAKSTARASLATNRQNLPALYEILLNIHELSRRAINRKRSGFSALLQIPGWPLQ